MQNALKSNAWQRICVHKTFKAEMQKGATINSAILQNWSPQEIRSPSLICKNFKSLRIVFLNYAECIEI